MTSHISIANNRERAYRYYWCGPLKLSDQEPIKRAHASMSGNEFFYKDEGGKKQDASLHEPILAAGDDESACRVGIEAARRAGLTEEAITKLYAPLNGSHKPDQNRK
jgi:hypothetical protein